MFESIARFLPLYRVNIKNLFLDGAHNPFPKGAFVCLGADKVDGTTCNPHSLSCALRYGWIVPFWKYGKVTPRLFPFAPKDRKVPYEDDRQVISLGPTLPRGWDGLPVEYAPERVDIPDHGPVYIAPGATEEELRRFYKDKAILVKGAKGTVTPPDEYGR